MKITNCRICNNKYFFRLFSLGKMSFTGKFPKNFKDNISKEFINLMMCKSCNLVQLDRNFNPKYLYDKNINPEVLVRSGFILYMLIKKIEFDFVSRNPSEFELGYEELTQEVFEDYQIIINTTPLGTHPNVETYPDLDYSLFTSKHLAFDLVYNPEETEFLKRAKENGASTKNGYEMLVFQAEKAWRIWNKK
mgnify:CR=1 FL=1